MLMITSMIASMMFSMTKHPLSMGLMLIIQTMLVAMITGMTINMFWFSYILLISMLSGMLVLFIYMASVASNEKFHTSATMIILTMMMFSSSIPFFFIADQTKMKSMWPTMKKDMMSNEQMLTLIKLFSLHNMWITLLLVSYLFITMITVSYVVNVHDGPLRTKN